MTIAIPETTHTTTAVAGTDVVVWEPELVETKPPWRPSEDEIVRAAIAVILVALGAIIVMAAGAILTMG